MNRISEDYVSFETAKLLKEKGFDWECAALYDIRNGEFREKQTGYVFNNSQWKNFITAPTLQMVMKWLRKVHHINANPTLQGRYDDPFENYSWVVSSDGVIYRNQSVSERLSYEEACEAAIKYCLGNLI